MPSTAPTGTPVIEARDVTVEHDQRPVVDRLNLAMEAGHRWVILGPNGSGKSTLVRVLSLRLHPTRGSVAVNGQALGDFDIRPVRARLALVSASLAGELRGGLSAHDAVMSAAHGALETWWHDYDETHAARARDCLARTGVVDHARRPISSLSSGELQRVLLARALMVDPIAVIFDEPGARLDLRGREDLVAMLEHTATTEPRLTTALVTHHVEEIPPSATHCLLMRNGRAVTSGPIDDTLTASAISECFGVSVALERRRNGRWSLHPL